MRRFDPSRPSQPVTQPERVGTFSSKLPHFIGFSCVCPKSPDCQKRQSGREFIESLQPKPQKFPFRGDDWRRQVRSPLSGRAGSAYGPAIFRRCVVTACEHRVALRPDRERPPRDCHMGWQVFLLDAKPDDMTRRSWSPVNAKRNSYWVDLQGTIAEGMGACNGGLKIARYPTPPLSI